MQQNGYNDLDLERFNPVHIAGMQSRATDILHGTFRAEMKLEGYNGGSCASFFWYHDDAQELDIEVVTPGTSIVNGTINYTTQPSANADWSRIPNATLSMPLKSTLNTFKTHRFDCDPATGVKYYLDNEMVHSDSHNTPRDGGSLQLKLWADGNKWWSGMPSKTDTAMQVKSIIAYYNTTSGVSNQEWHNRCAREKTQCRAITSVSEKRPATDCKKTPRLMECQLGKPSTTKYPKFTGTVAPISAGSPTSTCCSSGGVRSFVRLGSVVGLATLAIMACL